MPARPPAAAAPVAVVPIAAPPAPEIATPIEPPLPAGPFDVIIENARVMDPATGRDERGMTVAVRAGTIALVTARRFDAAVHAGVRIDARGHVVAPGFIDMLSYDPNPRGSWNKVADGVTTNLAMHSGAIVPAHWYGRIAAQAPPLNYGAAFFYSAARRQLGIPRDAPATAEQVRTLVTQADHALAQGALGVALSLEYYPGISRAEVHALLTVAHAHHATTFCHVRYSDPEAPGTNLEALAEMIDEARTTGAAVHIDHLPSTGGLLSMHASLEVLAAARRDGLDVTACLYPYNSWATFLNSARFDSGWQQRFRLAYGDLQLGGSSERLTARSFGVYRAEGRLVVAPGIPEAEVLEALAQTYTMIASDAILEPGNNNHPRASGTFARTLGVYVRERHALTLMDALRRMSFLPAQRLLSVDPGMARRGRLSEGADADVVIFDPDTVRDRATVEHPEWTSEGIEWVLVAGTVVLAPDGPRRDAHPGRPVRGPGRT